MEASSRLTAVAPAVTGRKERWIYLCSCGATVVKARRDVARGAVKSCGCLNQEMRVARSTKHGQAPRGHGNRLYWVWAAMIGRCERPADKEYARYGGRGIRVCRRWRDSFEDFASDMGPRPAGLTLERNDVDGDYEPGNCRWATWREQRMNQRRMKGKG